VNDPKELVLRGVYQADPNSLVEKSGRPNQPEGRNGLFLRGNGKQNESPLEQKWESQVTSIGLSE